VKRPWEPASDRVFHPAGRPALRGAMLALLAAFLFTWLNVVIRFSDDYLTIWHMVFGRSLFAVVFLFVLAKTTGVSLAGRQRKTLLLIGLAGTAGIFFLTTALLRIPLFQALILFYTYPAVAALISPRLTGDIASPRTWTCIGLAFAGTVLTLWSGGHGSIAPDAGHLFGLGASVCVGILMTLVRRVSDVNNPLTPIFYVSATALAASLVPMLLSGVGFAVPLPGLGWLFAIGLFAVSAHIATNRALGYIASAKVGSISMLEVFFSGVAGYFLFAESLGWSTLAGGMLIVIAGWGLVHDRG